MPAALNLNVSEWQWRASVAALFGVLPTSRLSGSKTYDPPSVGAGAVSATTTVALTGATLGMQCAGAFSLDLQGLVLNAWVSAADTVSVNLFNPTAGAIDLASGTLTAFAWVA